MNEKIKELIKNNPKSYAKLISNDPEMAAWVKNNSKTSSENWPKKIYSALTGESFICPNNNEKKLKSINLGTMFCGKAKICQCARDQISQKISDDKKSYTDDKKKKISEKRASTNLDRYGVKNVGQTEKAKESHKNFYNSIEKVEKNNKKIKQTMLQRYNVENPQQSANIKNKTKQTNILRYGVENPMKSPEVSKRSAETRSHNFDPRSILDKNYWKFKEFIKELQLDLLLDQENYIGIGDRPKLKFKCVHCSFEFEKKFDYASLPRCIQCNPTETKYVSNEENEVFEYIKSVFNGTIIQGDRSIINPYQLDIYLPEKNLAIEYCGLYWHSEISGSKKWNYHYNKMGMTNKKGIRLITIFSDEWINNKDLVKTKLLQILQLQSYKIGARKCAISEISAKTAKAFYDKNHIQGSRKNLGKTIALTHDSEIVAAMSFVPIGGKNYELCRFASSISIAGGASKLLKYFCKNNDWDSIISFADLRWSEGDLYKKLGFTEISRVPPMQTYVENYKNRYHKLKIKKERLSNYEPGKTEWQLMKELGYDRIWDCGKIKYEIKP